MSFFSKIGKGLKRGFKKIGRGIKRGTQEVGKVGKKIGDTLGKVGFAGTLPPPPQELIKQRERDGIKKGTFGQEIGRGFLGAMSRQGKAYLAPTRFIREIDPLKDTGVGKAGFSPISLAADIALAPVSSIGTLLETAGDKKERDKLLKGDLDKVIDVALAPLPFVPLGGALSKVAKVAKRGAKSVKTAVKGLSRIR